MAIARPRDDDDRAAALSFERLAPSRSWAASIRKWARRKPLGVIALALLLAIWGLCVLAPVIAPFAWNRVFAGPRLQGPTVTHLFGTDQLGQDVFSRVLYGGRLTLTVSILASVGGVALATVIGVLSGYLLGNFDLVVQRVMDAVQALPGLVVLLVIAAVFNGSVAWTMAVLVLLTAPSGARVLRSATLGLRGVHYIEAAHSIGASDARILARHVLPNVAPLIIIVFSLSAGANLLIEATLSFLGVINSTYPDWGTMLNSSVQSYMVSAPWLAIAPGAGISLAVLGYNLLGDALRDILDPRLN